MKRSILFQPLYFLFWVVYFLVARGAFLLYHLDRTQQLSGADILKAFIFGGRLDLSFTAYICALPFLFLLIYTFFKKLNAAAFLSSYTYAILVFITLLLVADLELYTYWGFRMDATPLQYLSTPAEMAASAAAAPLLLLFVVTLALSGIFILAFRFLLEPVLYRSTPNRWGTTVLAFLWVILLILPMRGGVQQIPINQSVAYFSSSPYANHASLNMPWNLMHALLKHSKQSKNPYQYMEPQEAETLTKAHYAAAPVATQSYVKGEKPNVLFIILESYTSKFIGSQGGEKGVTPNLDKLAAEGINFTNLYASGDRSEKGMVALLSGYPVQTITSIIKTPKKTEKLPQLSKVFKAQGYATSYFYGGELEFANIKSYLLNGGYDKLVDKADFPAESYNSKWGAHDHILFERVLQDLNQEKKPFFSTVYTLSSHEPYETPLPAKFPGDDNEAKFRNSVYYTDWALGKFIEAAKKQPWWQNTLVVLVADHGHPLPGNDENHAPSKFRIPLVLSGGALAKQGLEIKTIGSQTDIATTLLRQLNLPVQDFVWGKDLLAQHQNPFAFYVFNDGFGYITQDGVLTFDNVSRKPITRDAAVTNQQLEKGKAYMQHSFEDFIKK